MDKILVLNFGGQYDQLIARRIRAAHVYAEIRNYNKITPDEIRVAGYRGIVFTGGPNSVYDDTAPRCGKRVLSLGIPVLGICYGHQLLAFLAGGEIAPAETGSEYGKTTLRAEESVLFADVPRESVCWMRQTVFALFVDIGLLRKKMERSTNNSKLPIFIPTLRHRNRLRH